LATQVSHVIYPWEERITGMVVVTLAARPTSESYLMLLFFIWLDGMLDSGPFVTLGGDSGKFPALVQRETRLQTPLQKSWA